ncbi:PQQ-dependent sugar dehydrogenase [Pseudoduganella namucuonensis]|uniref:Glucose/arabinose dehydrogenase, beta-propeller fold n=1 Tax=Pseudoduganella namucuonensis TaxID=1035707 RepID=A0A1I7H1W6_9BURK|nr:PQQ-dependent sugar dehydrogenase [Pseudoduganella namucuonensis]SFU54671.1 Glucose/arabinose dehydrogenase, beta-propeller fold [Pseudoduganella namucuonensis]
MKNHRSRLLLSFAIVTLPLAADAAPPDGARLFAANCAMCHSVTPDLQPLAGPGLFKLLGRRIAGAPGYGYSAALASAGGGGRNWSESELDRFLLDPAAHTPGTTMPVSVPDPAERAALIAHLKTFEGQAAAPAAAIPPPAPAAAGGEHWSADRPGRVHEVRADRLAAPFATPSAGNSPRTVPRPRDAVPAVPAGFKVNLWATDPDKGRLLVKAPNGDLFMSSMSKRLIKVFRSSTGERADTVSVFASGLNRPFGFAFWPVGPNPRYLYVAYVNSIVRFPYKNGDLVAGAEPEVVVPSLVAAPGSHTTRTLVFSADGKTMHVSIGSASNIGEQIGPRPAEPLADWEAKHGLGGAWGDETDRGVVLSFDPDGGNRRTHATGLRNCVGMYRHPGTGDLFCSVNERDLLGDNLPPDYLTRVPRGAFFGWPWYYIGANEEPRLQGVRPDLRDKVRQPDLLVTAHSAPLGMVVYEAGPGPGAGSRFPAEYHGDMFLALHGSWNRATRTGSKVVRVFMKNGVPTGSYQDFATGFVVSDREVWGRPSSVAVQDDGSLLVVDDVTGEIWRVAPARAEAAR